MEELLDSYYEDGAKRLHNIVNRIFYKRYGGIDGQDMDQFYSIANGVFADIVIRDRYDPSRGDFDGFLYRALDLAIIDERKRQNRDKRTAKIEVEVDGEKKRIPVRDISLDSPVGEDMHLTVGDLLPSGFDMDAALAANMDGICQGKAESYLAGLNHIQRQIAEMKMQGLTAHEIKKKLKLSGRQYNRYCSELRSFANIRVLYSEDSSISSEGDVLEMDGATQTMENCKTDKISIASIIKRIDKHMIRFDHPLQRESDQWSPSMKGNLISDILQGNKLHPLIFAEQIINGVPIIWDLDGKQRCTNAYSFSRNGFKVSRNIRRWLIKYQTTKKNEKGKVILDANGFPVVVNDEFDIRDKKFSELPEELQDRFLDYSFNYDQYLNCSEEDIGYHIERYNDGKPMTASQKGITKLGTEYAEMVKSIASMPFFKDMGGYKVSEFKNGTINRVVVESVMAANFLPDWKKKQEDMCGYMKNHASIADFDNFEDMVQRLEKVVTDEVCDMFDSKDSFLWFGLFSRFTDMGLEDRRFVAFMAEFSRSLHGRKVEGVSFDDLNGKATKDKNVVVSKLNHLEKLMYEYLDGGQGEGKERKLLAFIRKNVSPEITQEDVDQYEEVLDDLTLNVDNSSNLMDRQNRLSLTAMVAYSFQKDIDLDDWIVDYFGRTHSYIQNQKENYLSMKRDLETYSKRRHRKIEAG